MGSMTDKIKGNVKEAVGELKQKSEDPETRAKGKKNELDGKIDQAKGEVKDKLDI